MKGSAIKTICIIVLGLGLGVTQVWLVPSYRESKHVASFPIGVLHGILMPAALPGLLMGKDLPIYASNNSGRLYNIGYILGINLCGTVFFGLGFRRGPNE